MCLSIHRGIECDGRREKWRYQWTDKLSILIIAFPPSTRMLHRQKKRGRGHGKLINIEKVCNYSPRINFNQVSKPIQAQLAKLKQIQKRNRRQRLDEVSAK